MSLRILAIRAAVLSLTLVATCGLPALAQISPGKLSEPHADLQGNLNCMKCHDAEHGVSRDLCLACHVLLREQLSRGKGLHARADHADCRTCHIEHHGTEFQLIWWGDEGRGSMDHAQTGYALEGAHARLGCRNCHRRENMRDPGPLLEQHKDLGRTLFGLDPGCLTCHTDAHTGQYRQTECLSCHSMERWRPADHFDHETTGYPLLGRHRAVACAKCHSPGDGDAEQVKPGELRFRGVSAGRCTDCHLDEHRGQLGSRGCVSCHTVDGWQPTTFDHAGSAYPLTGRHRQVECRKCHLAADSAAVSGESYRILRGIEFKSCADCHEDTHEGRLGPSCVGCHATDSWKSTAGTSFDHGLTRYSLEGRHRELRCEQCHAPGAPPAIAEFDRCTTCHLDIHLGQFAQREDGGACESCHSLEGFRPSRYTLADHQRTSFPIEGAHTTLACDKCHRPSDRANLPQATATSGSKLKFKFESTSCSDCHDDPHRGTLDRFMTDGDCEGCHVVASWVRIEFDHGLTRFRLEQAHRPLACAQCHRRRQLDGSDLLQWTELGAQCSDCHLDPHRGQFDRMGQSSDCRECHSSTKWKSLLFDHERDSRFRLGGAHARARCEACHLVQEVDDGEMVRFRPLRSDCAACHRPSRSLPENAR